ncbi:hypothetical protein [Streptomyces sp. WMMC940]|uniref:hypothetical protein n=1 Tax=Streptomyces sp. WMMC940 TaxID=3015153 RepID=UPI0022B61159|nr:hypothetical protein [Streptomyces sp. WMMC940]MCZ7460289.1 hypothetical protein [Streptomyces sp. WMMC940]
MLLRSFLTMPRLLRHGPAVGADLPPDEAVVLDARPAPLGDAVSAATAGDHGPARELLAATRLGAEWERRSHYVGEFADAAVHSPGWLDGWLGEAPEDPDATLVRADLSLRRAWSVRAGVGARQMSPDRLRAFFALLGDAVPVLGSAAELNPDDPVPWRIALAHATGARAPREVFDAYWAEATARAPHHHGCHAAALQYLCARWHGSHEEMFDFAERAAARALPGSKLHALPLAAAIEYDVVAGAGGRGPVDRSRIDAAVDRALGLSSFYGHGDPEAAGFRNELALMLVRSRRFDEALDVFRAIGEQARSHPWRHFGEPRREFLEFRTGVRMRIAGSTPLFSRPPESMPRSRERPPGRFAVHLLAIAAAPPARVASAALMCGVPLRIAPAGGSASYVAPAPDEPAGRRAALIGGEDSLTGAAGTFTTGEKWPTLVLRRTGDLAGFTLLHRGRKAASHTWDPSAPVTDHAAASATAEVLARVFGLSDPRPLTGLLRSSTAPARRQADLVTALGLPPLPAGFGRLADPLAGVPGTGLLERRGLLSGMRDTLANDPERLLVRSPGAAPPPRPKRWWLPRLLALTLFAPAAAWAWWSPGVGPLRSVLFSLLALVFGAQIVAAARQRGG